MKRTDTCVLIGLLSSLLFRFNFNQSINRQLLFQSAVVVVARSTNDVFARAERSELSQATSPRCERQTSNCCSFRPTDLPTVPASLSPLEMGDNAKSICTRIRRRIQLVNIISVIGVRSLTACRLNRGHVWNKIIYFEIILKLFKCFISHVHTYIAYI